MTKYQIDEYFWKYRAFCVLQCLSEGAIVGCLSEVTSVDEAASWGRSQLIRRVLYAFSLPASPVSPPLIPRIRDDGMATTEATLISARLVRPGRSYPRAMTSRHPALGASLISGVSLGALGACTLFHDDSVAGSFARPARSTYTDLAKHGKPTSATPIGIVHLANLLLPLLKQ